MVKKVTVSAPSTTVAGTADANDVAKETFGKDIFPCVKHVINNSPLKFFAISLKDVNGVSVILRGNSQVADHTPNDTLVNFTSFDELNGFVTDCEAYADAHGFKDAIFIEDVETSPVVEKPVAEAKTEAKQKG